MLVPGLRNTIALDFHLNQSALYWTDVVEDKIYRGKLSENGGEALYCNRFLCLKDLKAPSLWFVLTIEGPLSFMPGCTIFISEKQFYLQLKTSGNWRSNCSALIRFSRILLSWKEHIGMQGPFSVLKSRIDCRVCTAMLLELWLLCNRTSDTSSHKVRPVSQDLLHQASKVSPWLQQQ